MSIYSGRGVGVGSFLLGILREGRVCDVRACWMH